MALPKKFVVAPNAATRELWRVAESGEVADVANLLPRANINARNEHGMTALMRAAYHGRVEMVRALLDHGADPNVARNDNFTALSLAAFFGHTEIVEMLMDHGARTDVVTRYGTSPHMWAKARSYGEVAQCLQKRRNEKVALRTPKPKPEVVLPARAPAPQPARRELAHKELEPQPPAVRTLTEPPEIWDLVHEAPRDFSAGSAFIARVGSITAGVVLGLVAFVVVAGGIAGIWYLKDRQTTRATAAQPPETIAPSVQQPPSATDAEASTQSSTTETTAPDNPVDMPQISVPNPVVRRSPPRRSVATPQITQIPVESTASAPPASVAPKAEARTVNTGATANKPAPLSPQLISPPKTQQPKAKVIQWP